MSSVAKIWEGSLKQAQKRQDQMYQSNKYFSIDVHIRSLQCGRGGLPESSLTGTTFSAPWVGISVVSVTIPHLYYPIATPESLRNNNQYSMAESNLAVHAVAGIQTYDPIGDWNRCMRTTTATWMTESLEPTYPCHGGDSISWPSQQWE